MPAFSGMGTTVTISATAFVATSITTPSLKRGSIDVTSLSSPDNCKEFVPGMLEAGDFSMEFYFPGDGVALAATMNEALEAGYLLPFVITFPNSGSASFDAFITEFTIDPVTTGDNAVKGKITAKVSGKPTYVAVD